MMLILRLWSSERFLFKVEQPLHFLNKLINDFLFFIWTKIAKLKLHALKGSHGNHIFTRFFYPGVISCSILLIDEGRYETDYTLIQRLLKKAKKLQLYPHIKVIWDSFAWINGYLTPLIDSSLYRNCFLQ